MHQMSRAEDPYKANAVANSRRLNRSQSDSRYDDYKEEPKFTDGLAGDRFAIEYGAAAELAVAETSSLDRRQLVQREAETLYD